MFKNMRYPRGLAWLLPGLKIKRWFFLFFCGAVCIVLGVSILLELHPVANFIEILKIFSRHASPDIRGLTVILTGAVFILMGWKKTNKTILDAVAPSEREQLLELLYRKRKLSRGPKIVAVGGGTGLSSILKGLKQITNNITAVVTVGDDGGSSGRLREEMGILPPGDIRNCIAALANEESLVTELFQYRFKEGNGLEGHSFGNLFLSALCSITGDMVSAVKESSKVLSIRGRVLPATLDDMKLVAEMEDGRVIKGESHIPEANGKIKRLMVEPANARAQEDVLVAIENADIIILGPGSLYTSVIPNLLIKEISWAISKSKAKKVYICNVMTQPGETDDFSVSDHINAIIEHAEYKNIIEAVFVNDKIPQSVVPKYAEANSREVEVDDDRLAAMGIEVIRRRIIEETKEGFIRHNPRRLARFILTWYKRKIFKKEGHISPSHHEQVVEI